MIHTVIFDVGGTLVKADSVFHAFADIMDTSRREELFRYMRPIFLGMYRDESRPEFLTIKQIAAVVLKKTADRFDLPDISERVPELYADCYLGHATLFEDVLPTLERLKTDGLKLTVVSDADADVLDRELTSFDIEKYFDNIVVSSNVKAYKPSDRMVRAIMDTCQKPYTDVLFVGNIDVDILAAKKMKARSVLVRRNGKFPYDADYNITDLSQLFGIISQINNKAYKKAE
jgi:putative hydrolase of the HAD superfamily